VRRTLTPLERLKRIVDAIERGQFELVEYEAVADKSDRGRYIVTLLLDRLVAPGKPNKKPPRQSKVRELIFDEED
jgi:hypothetical protein